MGPHREGGLHIVAQLSKVWKMAAWHESGTNYRPQSSIILNRNSAQESKLGKASIGIRKLELYSHTSHGYPPQLGQYSIVILKRWNHVTSIINTWQNVRLVIKQGLNFLQCIYHKSAANQLLKARLWSAPWFQPASNLSSQLYFKCNCHVAIGLAENLSFMSDHCKMFSKTLVFS